MAQEYDDQGSPLQTTTTAAPPLPTTTAPPPPPTTTAPPTTTTAPPPPPTTTTAPPPTTTTAPPPPPTTTTAPPPPPTTTTAPPPPPTTTTAPPPPPTTTTAPPPPPTTTTAPPAPATTTTAAAAPAFTSVSVDIDPDDGGAHLPNSVQASTAATLTLSWETSGATAVHIDGLGDFGPSGSTPLPAQDASYSLVASSDGGATSDPWPLEIHTHEPDVVVSQHATIPFPASVVSFTALKDGQPVTAASPGDTVTLTLVCAGGDGARIAGQDAELSPDADGNLAASVEVTISDAGSFDAQLLQDGQVADGATVTLEVAAPPPSAWLQIGGGAEASLGIGEAVRLSWKAAGAARAVLSCDTAFAACSSSVDGTTDESGALALEVYIDQPMPSMVTLADDSGSPVAVWEFDLQPPDDEPGEGDQPAGDPPTIAFGSLKRAQGGLELQLDPLGAGEGELVVSPAPSSSTKFKLTVTPKDGSPEQAAEVTAHVANFVASLLLPDGSPAPAGRPCALLLGVTPGDSSSSGRPYFEGGADGN